MGTEASGATGVSEPGLEVALRGSLAGPREPGPAAGRQGESRAPEPRSRAYQ